MNDNTISQRGRPVSPVPRKPALPVALLYPGDSLVQQMSAYRGERPACEFQSSQADSPSELHKLFQNTAISVIDATSDPDRAVAALDLATERSDGHYSAAYTEKVHEGLELSVRSRGALLLLGPLSQLDWEGLFEAAWQSVGRAFRFGFLAQQRTENDAASTVVWQPKQDAEHSSHNRFRKIA
ncbi:MAG: hypothetical protein HQ567_29165 [Candidatus Nealsonbacteria bacterium]|nr:hypothetical protein [Candidatus Nealsonbacteria bacterium]